MGCAASARIIDSWFIDVETPSIHQVRGQEDRMRLECVFLEGIASTYPPGAELVNRVVVLEVNCAVFVLHKKLGHSFLTVSDAGMAVNPSVAKM